MRPDWEGVYYTLIPSLPALPELGLCEQLPISRIAAERRLSVLEIQQLQLLQGVEQLVRGGGDSQADEQVVGHWRELVLALPGEPLQGLFQQVLEMRTVLAALRLRRSGVSEGASFVGYGRWAGMIRQRWQEPVFGLDEWLPEAKALAEAFASREVSEVETLLQNQLWLGVTRLSSTAPFTFAAVVCWWVKWVMTEQQIEAREQESVGLFRSMVRDVKAGAKALTVGEHSDD